MDYLSVAEFAETRGVSPSRVMYWLKNDRLAGARKIGHYWAIPAAANPEVKLVGRPRKELSFREQESAMLKLCVAAPNVKKWKRAGPPWLMAGMAMMLSSSRYFDRARYVALAERLDPSVCTKAGLERWLERTPFKPCRFMPQVKRQRGVQLAQPWVSRGTATPGRKDRGYAARAR